MDPASPPIGLERSSLSSGPGSKQISSNSSWDKEGWAALSVGKVTLGALESNTTWARVNFISWGERDREKERRREGGREGEGEGEREVYMDPIGTETSGDKLTLGPLNLIDKVTEIVSPFWNPPPVTK